MPPSPPLSLAHPAFYYTDFMDDTPATSAAAAESHTGLALASEAPQNTSGLGPPAQPEKKRRRPALSCEQCRRRKIRCDRGLPCVNCVKSKITPCTYAPTHIPASRGKKATTVAGHSHDYESSSDRGAHVPFRTGPGSGSGPESRTSPSDVFRTSAGGVHPEHIGGSLANMPSSSVSSTVGSSSENSTTVDALLARVRQLEQQLAKNVYITQNPGEKFVPEDESKPASEVMKGTVSKTRFFGQSHWMNGTDLFPNILRVLNEAEARRIEPYGTFVKCKNLGRAIKERRIKPLATDRLGETVPARELADQLVDAYFDSFEGAIRILHKPTFQTEYERYWQNPSAASSVFVMQLQLCMAIGAAMHDDLFALRSQAMQWVHEAQIWLLLPPEKSRMTLAGIQVMCMLIIAKATSAVGQDLTWVTTGSLVRQAMYMGLHRDPRKLSEMTVYRAEMRRRLWWTILELNLESSFDAGGPPLISAKHYDTLMPANLNDDQLTDDPDNRDLMNPRPDDLTDMSLQLALFKSLPTRLAVIKHINEFRSKESYPETLRLNSDLTKACRTLTETLSKLSQAQKRTSRTVITSFHSSLIQLFMYRCFISLHQPMLSRAADDPTFYYSRKVSLDCSLKMAQICGLSTPSHIPAPPGPVDPTTMFDRLITNGAGVFRVVPVQTQFAIALELIHKKEEERESLGSIPSMGTADLHLVLDAAVDWTERRIRSGETNIKGHCFLTACVALADSIAIGLSSEQADQTVIDVGARVSIKCWDLLKTVAEREGVSIEEEPEPIEMAVGPSTVDSNGMGDFMDLGFDWTGDLDWNGIGAFSWGKPMTMPKTFDDANLNQMGPVVGIPNPAQF